MIPPTEELDRGLLAWIDRLSTKWGLSQEETAVRLGEGEVENRLDCYPVLAEAVRARPITLQAFSEATRACWALGGRFTQVRMNAFLKHPGALDAIQRLVFKFPESAGAASNRIDSFVEDATDAAFQTPTGGKDKSGAALLASVILTSAFPDRFVDYRHARWQRLAEQVGYTNIPRLKAYGERLLWAGEFASTLARSKTFQTYWPEGQATWVLSGLSWQDPSEPQPEMMPTSLTEPFSVPEGGQKRRLHLVRERNQTVVRAAKKLALQRDGILRCEVCHFCFSDVYGPHGDGFVEAHHRVPVSKLKPGSRTRVCDIALLCANCHRMIHRGDRTLSVDELRSVLQVTAKR